MLITSNPETLVATVNTLTSSAHGNPWISMLIILAVLVGVMIIGKYSND